MLSATYAPLFDRTDPWLPRPKIPAHDCPGCKALKPLQSLPNSVPYLTAPKANLQLSILSSTLHSPSVSSVRLEFRSHVHRPQASIFRYASCPCQGNVLFPRWQRCQSGILRLFHTATVWKHTHSEPRRWACAECDDVPDRPGSMRHKTLELRPVSRGLACT